MVLKGLRHGQQAYSWLEQGPGLLDVLLPNDLAQLPAWRWLFLCSCERMGLSEKCLGVCPSYTPHASRDSHWLLGASV